MASSERLSRSAIGISLVLVDVQNDFLSGTLPVPDGPSTLAPIQKLLRPDKASQSAFWSSIILSQDFHPKDHISFAANHPGKKEYEEIDVPHPLIPGEEIKQMMWPIHCVQGTWGCEIEEEVKETVKGLKEEGREELFIIQKGTDSHVDGYSALSDNAYSRFTPMIRLLSSIDIAVVAGVATDYCILATAMDLLKFGLQVWIPRSGVKGVAQETTEKALEKLEKAGARLFDNEEEVLEAIAQERQSGSARRWRETFDAGQEAVWNSI